MDDSTARHVGEKLTDITTRKVIVVRPCVAARAMECQPARRPPIRRLSLRRLPDHHQPASRRAWHR